MKRVLHKDSHLLKYAQKVVYNGTSTFIQALHRTTTAPSYYDVDIQKYREVLRKLEKGKEVT